MRPTWTGTTAGSVARIVVSRGVDAGVVVARGGTRLSGAPTSAGRCLPGQRIRGLERGSVGARRCCRTGRRAAASRWRWGTGSFNRTPMTGATPGMPYTAMRRGSFRYRVGSPCRHRQPIVVPRFGMALLYQETGDQRFLDYARHVAEVLEGFVAEDGRSCPTHPSGHRAGRGAVHLRPRARGAVPRSPRPDRARSRWRDAALGSSVGSRSIRCMTSTGRGCFEDVGRKRRFANLAREWTHRGRSA